MNWPHFIRFLRRNHEDRGNVSISEAIFRSLHKRGVHRLSKARRQQRGFEKRLYHTWREALDFYAITLDYSREIGARANAQRRQTAAKEGDYQFDVLTRLHARSCTIASEILTLMRTGHASGAYARWRSLHELAVVSVLIREGDQELAERYLAHDAIESARAARDYITYQERIDLDPVTEEEVREVELQRDALVEKYGAAFKGQYGWASHLFKHGPNFRQLEERAGLDHWRPYYRMASFGVHANPKGVLWDLGAGWMDTFLLAGVTNAGLADPGHQSLISLVTVTSALLSFLPSGDHVIHMEVLAKLVHAAGQVFINSHEEVERRTVEARRSPRTHRGSGADPRCR